ncbi:DUF5133 domain-containing protein [Streptomyces sp. NPDC026206]|uniref:DUF5133 domain-containing protein n=1 Tax=Streptomyces sp. NPDC026206 TaxID=3157089 RepID=UPI00340941C2
MLMAHPGVLRDLLSRYDTLLTLARERAGCPRVHRRLQDTVYTLCVTTGTRDIDAALRAARSRLAHPHGAAVRAAAV